MGSLGAPEILVIAIVALLVFGPKRLPEIARSVGRAVREFKRATSEFTDELRSGLDDITPTPPSKPSDTPTTAPTEPKPGPRD